MSKKPFPFKVCEQCCATGGDITIDATMSDTSENAVQNKVVKAYTDGKINEIDKRIGNIDTALKEDVYTKTEVNKQIDDINSALNKRITRQEGSNALKGNVSGEIVSITDISPVEHNLDVKVSSKNLFNNDTSLLKEITYTSNGGVQNSRIGYEPFALPAGTYTFTINDLDTSTLKYIYGFICDKDNKFIRNCSLLAGTTNYTPLTITINEGEYIYIYNGNSALYVDVRAKEFNAVQIQLEKGTTATTYTPYVDVSETTLTACGKNLFNNDTSLIKEVVMGGMNGTTQSRFGYEIHLPAGLYTLSSENVKDGIYIYVRLNDKDGNYVINAMKDRYSTGYDKQDDYFIANDKNNGPINIKVNSGDVLYIYDAVKRSDEITEEHFNGLNIQLEKGETATGYEPYAGQAYSPNADGTVENAKSIYPTTTLLTDTSGILIDCEYNKDINKAFAELQNAIISLGGNV